MFAVTGRVTWTIMLGAEVGGQVAAKGGRAGPLDGGKLVGFVVILNISHFWNMKGGG